MVTSTKGRLMGERPRQGVTPDSPLALHEAGYRAVLDRTGLGRILDVGCGQGFESARFLDEDRQVVGVDYSSEAAATATACWVKAKLVLRLDVFDLRHRIPHSWYVWAYTRLLPVAYKLIAREDSGDATDITADDWFVTENLDNTTLVLFAGVRGPRRAAVG